MSVSSSKGTHVSKEINDISRKPTYTAHNKPNILNGNTIELSVYSRSK